ncbi:hypothetical protein U1Q18_027552, partial [Sarracenia purpurea var. burkii]
AFDKRPKEGDGGNNVAPTFFHSVDRMPNVGSGCVIKEQAGGLGSKTDTEGKAFLRPQTTKIQGTRTWANVVGNDKRNAETPRLNQRSSLVSKLEFFAPKVP